MTNKMKEKHKSSKILTTFKMKLEIAKIKNYSKH